MTVQVKVLKFWMAPFSALKIRERVIGLKKMLEKAQTLLALPHYLEKLSPNSSYSRTASV